MVIAPNPVLALQWHLLTVSKLQFVYISNILTRHVVPCHPAVNQIPPALVEYHPSSNPPPFLDYFGDSMIGRALLEWNSRIGVSVEAWHTVATAFVHCTGCNRVRSFDGDCLHRDGDGRPFCGGPRLGLGEDVNDEPVAGKGKGKERAI